MPSRKIRVLVVDDSALVRKILSDVLARDPQIEVVGTAGDPYIAKDKIIALQPDVLTLDVEMPRMDGLRFLELVMTRRPMPVVMVSTMTEEGAETTLRALELGAVDFVTKASLDVARRLPDQISEIAEKVKLAAKARVSVIARRATPPPRNTEGNAPRPRTAQLTRTTQAVVAIGASTGGTEALRNVLSRFPADAPATVVVQHMPAAFTSAFARRLSDICAVGVKEAADGDRVLDGHVLLAPGGHHMRIERRGTYYVVRISDDPPVNFHRPSVDVLFDSVAEHVGRDAVGVVLTGMGDDGARGLLGMREAGARTLVQDQATSLIWGMPRVAAELGAAEYQVPLDDVAAKALSLAHDRDRKREREASGERDGEH